MEKRLNPIIPIFPYWIISLILISSLIYSQPIYKIPFGSRGNVIELEIANETGINLERVKVEIKSKPEWIRIEETKNEIEEIKSGEEGIALIKFTIEKTSEIGKEEEMKLIIKSENRTIEEKAIKIEAEAPKEYVLEQNYPNPFNPVTRIGYQIPEEGKVEIKVYDILGREIEVIDEGNKKRGYYEVEYNGGKLSSGIYIYSLIGKGIRINKKMMVMK
ncbi:T9SS type A sorting domain-containing protein [Ignavibacteria bacterium 4148-Me]|uniref:T9SS type A sorting domain-containing protein n=1 Tax=Rosettibacter primus TaxID=3111523 RepID=UPI00336BFFC8